MDVDKVVTPEFVAWVRKLVTAGTPLADAVGSGLALRQARHRRDVRRLDVLDGLFPGHRYGDHKDPLRIMARVQERIAQVEAREEKLRREKPVGLRMPDFSAFAVLPQSVVDRALANRQALRARTERSGIRAVAQAKPTPQPPKPAPATRHWRMVKNGVVIAEGTSRF